jgi:hypothetical protein
MFAKLGRLAGGMSLLGIVALPACSPRGRSSGEGSVQTVTRALGISPATWRQEGPTPLTNCGVHALPFDDCTGAAQQTVVDPTNGAIYLATVNGGIFKTTDSYANTIGANPPVPVHWNPLINNGPSLSMSALAMDPTDPSTLIAGTGTYSSEGATGTQGVIYLLKNGGATVTTSNDLVGHKISAMTIRGSLALAITSDYGVFGVPAGGGAFASHNGGKNWSSILGTGGLPSNIGNGWDLVTDPSNSDRYYLAAGTGNNPDLSVPRQGGIYVGTNSGQAWVKISGFDASSGVQSKLDHAGSARLAVSPTGRLYLEIIQFNEPVYVGFTDDGGHHFTAMDLPSFPPATCDSGSSLNPVAITSVTVGAQGEALVTTSAPRCRADANGTRVRITGVQGLPTLSGDYVLIGVPDSSGHASPTELTVADTLMADGNGNPIEITAADLVGGAPPPPGTVIGTGGTLLQWEGPNGGQGDKQAIAADPSPATPNFFYISGDFTDEMVVRGDTTQGATGGIPSPQWVSIANSGTTNGTRPHVDTRHLAFDTSGNLLVTCDGGLYVRKNPQGPEDWYTLNGNAQTAEMHDVAFDPVSHGLFGGLQDNGTASISQSIGAPIPWGNLDGNDGGDVKSVAVLSTTDSGCQPVMGQPICSYRYTSPNGLNLKRHLFSSSGVELDQNNGMGTNGAFFVVPALLDTATGAAIGSEDGFFFVTPFEVNKQDSNRLLISGQRGVWESLDLGQTATLIANSPPGDCCRPSDQNGTGPTGTLAYGHPSNPDAIWVASDTGVFARFTAGAAMTKTASFPPTNDVPNRALSVVMSSANPQVAFATSEHNVFETTNGGTSWTTLTGDLAKFAQAPNQGPGLLRKIVYVPSATTGDRIFVAAGDLGQPGVFMMAVANPGVWTRVGTNLPNALAYDLDYDHDSTRDELVVGLVGGGAWTIANVTQLDRAPVSSCSPSATLPADATCHATPTPATFNAVASDPDGNPLTITLSPTGPRTLGTTAVTITSTDNQGAASACNSQLTVVDVTAPIITAPPPVSVSSCVGGQATSVGTATATDNCTTPVITGQVISQNGVALNPPVPVVNGQVNLGPGTYVIRWSASDGVNIATTTQTVTVGAGIEASQSFLLDDRSTIKTPGGGFAAVLNAGSGQTKIGQDVRSGGVVSVGPVAVQHRAIVNGSVVSASTITKDSDATITGTSTQFASVLLPALPTLPAFPTPTLGSFTVNSGTQSHGPGSYTSGTVNGGTLVLSAGDYFFQSLTINANVTVRVQPTTRIFVRNTLVFQSPLLAASGSTVQRITLGFAGTTTLSMLATFNGTLIAPTASVIFGTDTSLTFTGSFFARTLEVNPGNNLVCSP